MPNTMILPFNTTDATLANAGGKGQNLTKLAHAGLPVPPGFIISTDAYRAFVAANKLENSQLFHDDLSVDEASDAIRARFAAGVVPADLAAAILTAYHDLAIASFASHPMSGCPVAVRSSATAEDLPDLSFAGQQDTFLNVMGDEALLHAVIRCWSSLWTARAVTYRERNGIAHDDVALAVVVQAMVESEASGVLFTANPLTGKRSEVVVDATLGLGEALVSGQVEPDQIVIDVAAGTILSKQLGAKATVIRGQAGGGIVTMTQDAAQRQALPDAALLELARLGKRVEQALYDGQPQDIEWAWAGERLYLLQSRAITSLYPLPNGMPAAPLQVLFSMNHLQGMLDPFTTIGQDALKELYLAISRVLGREFAADTQREVVIAGERVYGNITPLLHGRRGRRLLLNILGAVEPGAQEALRTVLDGPDFGETGHTFSLRGLNSIVSFLILTWARIVRLVRQPDAGRREVMARVEAELTAFRTRAAQAATPVERIALAREAFNLLTVIFPRLSPPMAVGIGSFILLRRLARLNLGDEQLALEVARGLPHNVTTEMDLSLWVVAEVIAADAASAACFASQSAEALAAEFDAGSLPIPAQAALAAFMDRYGMRGLAEIDLGRPRWREDPTHIMQAVQSYLAISDPQQAPDAVFQRGAERAEAALAELVQRLQRAGVLGPVKARLAARLGRLMRSLAGLRETPKFTVIRMMGMVRGLLLQNGAEWVAAGKLRRADDVMHLHLDELAALARGDGRDWQAVVDQRHAAYTRELLRKQVPRLLLSDGTAFYAGVGAGVGDGNALAGSPVSPGMVEGTVRVVFDPRTAQLAPGDILVCPGTDPSWTPLFLAAGGLVMEVGGLMTHGSVVAREYGIPAVVGVHEATTRLRSGQRVRVDGSAGRVTILDDEVPAIEIAA